MILPFDAPFVPEAPGDRLNADGSRDLTALIAALAKVRP